MGKDTRIPVNAKIGKKFGTDAEQTAEPPTDSSAEVARERGYRRQVDNTSEMGINRNRSLDPADLNRPELGIHRGGVEHGKATPVRAGHGVRGLETTGEPMNLRAPVGGVGKNAMQTRRGKPSGVRSLGGRLDDEENPPRIHGED